MDCEDPVKLPQLLCHQPQPLLPLLVLLCHLPLTRVVLVTRSCAGSVALPGELEPGVRSMIWEDP